MDSLPQPHQDSVNEFIAITDIPADDEHLSKAIALLEYHDFNLNNSVLAFFERGLDLPQESSHTPVPDLIPDLTPFASGVERFESTAMHRNLQSEFVMTHLFPKLMKASRIPNRWVSDLATYKSQQEKDLKKEESEKADPTSAKKPLVWWMLLLIFPKTITLILTALRYLFRFNRVVYESRPNKFNFLDYDSLYSILHDINASEELAQYDVATENFNETHEHCQREYEFLLTILVDDNSIELIRILIKNSSFKAMFNRSTGEFKECRLFIANVDKSPEALEVAQVYRYRKIPYLFAAANVSSDPAVMSSMALIYKANCYLGDAEEKDLLVGKITRALRKSCTDFSPQLITKRYDKQEMELSRLLKEKQDEAYLESLQSDIIKKQEKVMKQKAEDCKKELARKKAAYLSHLLKTEYFTNVAKEASTSESVRIAIKLPNGKRIVQKFLKSAKLCEIYLFVETQMFESELEEVAEEIEHDEYIKDIGFTFEMFKPLPKCVLPSTLNSIEEFGELKSGDTVLIEYTDDYEEQNE